jgi:membrane protease subunit HflK
MNGRHLETLPEPEVTGQAWNAARVWLGPRRAPRRASPWLGGLVLLGIAGYLMTGIFTVAADEQAVVRRFGRVESRLGPGIHYRLPWPVDRVDVLKATAVMKTGVGFELPEDDTQTIAGIEMLTGDTNIISIAIALQYIVRNPAAYLFETEQPATLIGSIAESVLTETVLGMPVDEVLTTGRLAIQDRVKAGTQTILDRYQSGIQLTAASIMTITLDSAVAQAFQDAASATADRENKINEARTYANNLLPKTRGEARSMVLAAQSAKDQRVAEAIGNTTRFLELLAEYSKAPDITRSRLYLEAMEKILPRIKKYVIDSERGRQPVNLRLSPPK